MKLLLAGMEDKNSMAMAQKFGVRDILISAMYMHKKGSSYIDEVLTNFDFVFLDSGAFTINSKWTALREEAFKREFGANWETVYKNHARYMEWRRSDQGVALWQQILDMTSKWEEQYLAMLRSDPRFKNREAVHCVELDVGSIEDRTARRKRFESEGFSVVPVLKPDDHDDYVEAIIKEYDYVGFGGIATQSGKMGAKDFQKRMALCRKYMTRVHGFGMTRQEPMRRQPFYSVDSTSWLSGARYGTTYEFRSGKLKMTQDKAKRKQFKRQCEQYDIDYAGLLADSGKAINEWNMCQWHQYSEWLTKSNMKKAQEFWHDKVNGGELSKMITEEGEVVILGSNGEPYVPPPRTDEDADVIEDSDEYSDETTEIEVVESLPSTPVAGTGLAKNHPLSAAMYINCATCIMGENCPLYKENSKCRVDFGKVEGTKDFPDLLQYLFTLQKKRITLGAMQESVDGGIINDSVSKEIDRMMRMMQQYKDLTDTRDEVTIKAKGSGILAQIFGGKTE